ncbi:membrane-bound metal-dependent hydrolase [Pyrolobus fumarii 1A]|uniref:Membrane-bound metal-dependent hydrolase n=1 Tax=Pyrolobus fumarii (strain DSM 11204 / 1A) TaxID=694429 RepID=G0EFP7_PYRF1|nr:metal-dependent hydrolase [Pyrolobus fumarii]AEM38218.1 membrane-bound metal-dependent hydrolase [Pyrolobus fumarii 1A]
MRRKTHLSIAAGVVALLAGLLHAHFADFGVALLAALAADEFIDALGHVGRRRAPWTHNLFACLLLPALITAVLNAAWRLVTPLAYPLAAAGTATHLALDALTPAGVWPLWPLSRRRLRGPIHYDDPTANTILTTLGAAAFIVGVSLLAWHAS